jgi:Signal transduction histidine kinase
MFQSIKTKLTFIICSILIFVFSMQMAANFLFAEHFYIHQKIKVIQNVYQQIKSTASTSSDSITDIINNLDVDKNIEFILADENMDFIYTSRIIMPRPGAPQPPDSTTDFDFKKYPIEDYINNKVALERSEMPDFGRIRLLGTIKQNNKTYYLTIRISVKSINQDRSSTNLFILYISTFALVAGGLLVYLLAKKIVKPIEDINQVAIHVSNLDFSTRTPDYHSKDEIGSLAVNINTMSEKLEHNILELKNANLKLEQDNEYMNKVDEMRKEFIANVSHELKTPLSILTGYTEMLNSDIPGLDQKFYYETILDETHKMDLMIQKLLNLSHMDHNLANLEYTEINLIELTTRIYHKNMILFQKKGIQSELQCKSCAPVLGDALSLEEAITNYLANAIRHTESGHKIILTVFPQEDEVVVSVFNEGKNIDESQLDKIWTSFYRTDKSRTRTSENNIGLGLYIVQTIMNTHQGKYGVNNKENGVEFWLSLKVIDVKNQRNP